MDRQNQTPLHRACSKGHLATVRKLVAASAAINVKDAVGNTPLHLACEGDCGDVVTFLLEHGASSQAVNKDKLLPRDVCSKTLQAYLDRFMEMH
jgi:26S proteasome non-ATPase regulatory subunit 10